MDMLTYGAQLRWKSMLQKYRGLLVAQFVRAQNRTVEDEVSKVYHKWTEKSLDITIEPVL